MRRPSLLLAGLLLISSSAFAQAPSTDSQTLQALLAEVRQLRQDVQTTMVAVQRAQILLYRLQTQEAAVMRAVQRLDEARSQLAATQSEQSQLTYEVKRAEDILSRATNPNERKETEDTLPRYKARLEALRIQEQDRQGKELAAREQLRTEEAKLAELQSLLDRLDQELQSSGRPPARSPH